MPKYSTQNSACARLLRELKINYSSEEQLSAGLAKSSWAKHEAAHNSLKKYEKTVMCKCTWPLSEQNLAKYCTWGVKNNLKCKTIRSYLSSLETLHDFKKMDTKNFKSKLLKTQLNGIQNIENYTSQCKNTRKVMTVPLLRLLGHTISKTIWEPLSKQLIWTACTLAFFGSFRMGELLCSSENSHNSYDTLLWSDVKFVNKDHILIHVKSPKSKQKEGEFIDIFSFKNKGICPIKAMLKLKEMVGKNDNKPVFCFNTNANITTRKFNETLDDLVEPLGWKKGEITGHSFRAGIPAALASHPNMCNSLDVMGWGRWKSTAYLGYTRLTLDQKKEIYTKIIDIL